MVSFKDLWPSSNSLLNALCQLCICIRANHRLLCVDTISRTASEAFETSIQTLSTRETDQGNTEDRAAEHL